MRNFAGWIVGVLVLGVMLVYAKDAAAWELYWNPVTTWTDNTAIEPEHLPMSYLVEWDGNVQPATVESSWPIPQPSVGHGTQHTARVQAKTATGWEGAFSDPFLWSSPEGTVPAVRGIGVR